MADKDTWAVVPARNEEQKIGSVIRRVRKYVSRVIVVDDGSEDDTFSAAEDNKAVVLRHMVNLGKGAAVKTGCDYALRNGAENIVLVDADGQHEPEEIPHFLEALKSTDIVFGYRRLNREMPFVLRIGNRFINSMLGMLYGMKLRDTQCGYRAFRASAYPKIRWKACDYSMESEMIANSGKKGLRYKEMPIKTIYADRYKGTTVIDGVKIVLKMMGWRIFR